MADEQGVDKSQMKQYLVPAVGVAAVIVLVGLVLSFSGASEQKMSDGSDGSAGDPGLKEASPGVKIRDLKEGSGDECPSNAQVKVNYTGWLTDGTVFDSNKKPGDDKAKVPVSFSLNKVVAGWKEGLTGMKAGGIRKLVIAPDKAYGNRQSGKIPPNSTLIFEVELVSFMNVASGAGQPMPFDKSNGGTDDKDLKDLDGIKYRDLKEGTGDPAKPGTNVTIHYVGWTVDGNVFDSSREKGKPADFDLNRLIKGWQIGIPGMKPGGVRKLVIPSDLGYGPEGQGENIPGGATLIFEVELLK